MARSDFLCVHRLRVRWAEVDMQKVVFNGHYLTYIDTAVAEYWRAIGLQYPEAYVKEFGQDLFLRKAAVDYLGAAHYDEDLAVCCRISRLGRTSMNFSFEIYRGEAVLLVTAELVYVNVELPGMQPAPLPQPLRDRILRFEKAAPAQ